MSLSEQIEELEDRIEELEDENSDLESEIDNLRGEKKRLEGDLRELQKEIEELESQVEKGADYSIFEHYDSNYNSSLQDSKSSFILCVDSLDELENSNNVESGVRLYNTRLYEWVNVANSSAQYEFVLKRK